MRFLFSRFQFPHTPQKNVFHVVLIFMHLKEKYNLIKRNNDEVNDEEGEEYVLTFAHPSWANIVGLISSSASSCNHYNCEMNHNYHNDKIFVSRTDRKLLKLFYIIEF